MNGGTKVDRNRDSEKPEESRRKASGVSSNASRNMIVSEVGPSRSEESTADVVTRSHNNEEADDQPAAASTRRTSRGLSVDEEGVKELRDVVTGLSQRVAEKAASGNGDRPLEEDLSLLQGALVRYNKNSSTYNSVGTTSRRPTEACWKEEVRPALERGLRAALAAAQHHPSLLERSCFGFSFVDFVDELLAMDPLVAFLAHEEDRNQTATPTAHVGQRGGQNLLHLVVAASSPAGQKSDLVQRILRRVAEREGVVALQRLVDSTDPDGMRPIDTLTAQILMKEERAKYRDRRRRMRRGTRETGEDDDCQHRGSALRLSDLDDSWECARMIVSVHAGEPHTKKLPVVHACLAATASASAAATAAPSSSSVPRALLESALRRYPEQLRQPDSSGNLPLHYAAAAGSPRAAASSASTANDTGPSPADPNDDNDDDDEAANEDEEDAMPRILALHQGAARVRNLEGYCPVDVAIRAGRRWRTGIAVLGAAHPEALLDLSRRRALLPQLVALLRRDPNCQPPGILYRLIRASPNAVQAFPVAARQSHLARGVAA
jgi:hypothetical protein